MSIILTSLNGAGGYKSSIDDGLTWITRTPSISPATNQVPFSNGKLWYIYTGTKYFTSIDGITWSTYTSPLSDLSSSSTSLHWGEGKFLSLDTTNNISRYSTNFSTWQQSTMTGLPTSGFTVTTGSYSNNTWVCVGNYYNSDLGANYPRIYTSANSVDWVLSASLDSNYESASVKLIKTAAGWFLYSPTSVSVATSTNGTTWTSTLTSGFPIGFGPHSISYNGSIFVAIAADYFNIRRIYSSTNGIDWTERLTGLYANSKVAWNNSVFCACTSAGYATTSPDGITWTTRGLSGTQSYLAAGPAVSSLLGDTPITFLISSSLSYYSANHTLFGNSYINILPSSTLVLVGAQHFLTGNSTISFNIDSLLSTLLRHDIVGSSSIYFNINSSKITTPRLVTVSDSFSLSSTLVYYELTKIVEQISLFDNNSSRSNIKLLISDYINIVDKILITLKISISESIFLASTLSSIIKRIETITSILSVKETISTTGSLSNIIVSLITILGEIDRRTLASITDAILISSTISSLYKSISLLLDSIVLVDSNIGKSIQILSVVDSILINSSVLSNSLFRSNIFDSFVISIPTIEGSDKYLAYLFSPETSGISNYNNYNFDSCTKFNSKYLFSNSTGLYEYGGDLDDLSAITSHLETVAYDFGSSNLKQVPAVYLGLSSSGSTIMKVKVDGKAEVIYKLNKKTSNLQTQKVEIGKGLIGRYFQFELITEAPDFSIESIEFYPLELKRKI